MRHLRVAYWLAFSATVLLGVGALADRRARAEPEGACSASIRAAVVDLQGHAIPGAEVRAYALLSLAVQIGSPGDLLRATLPLEDGKATASTDGLAQIDGLAAGRYVLRASAEGHSPLMIRGAVAWPAGGPVIEVRLGPAQRASGRVLDAQGHALRGVVVALGPSAGWETDPLSPQVLAAHIERSVGRSAEDGSFVFGDAPTTDGTGTGVAPSGFELYLQPTADQLYSVHLDHLPTGVPSLSVALGGTGAATGKVYAGSSVPADRASVTIRVLTELSEHTAVAVFRGVSQAGAFKFGGLPAGHLLSALAAKETLMGTAELGSAPLAIPSEGFLRMEIALKEPIRLAGRIHLPDGTPARGAEVLQVSVGSGDSSRATADEGGAYVLGPALARPASLRLGVLLRGFVLPVEQQVQPVQSSQGITAPVITLAPAGSILGTVVDAFGAGVSAAEVWCSPAGSPSIVDLEGAVVCGQDGSFVLPALDGRNWNVFASRLGRAPVSIPIALKPGENRMNVVLRLSKP